MNCKPYMQSKLFLGCSLPPRSWSVSRVDMRNSSLLLPTVALPRYATRDKHAQQTLELQNQTVAMEHQQQLQTLRLQLTRAAEDKVKAAKEEFAKENAALQQELNDHREQLNQLSAEYAQVST